MLRNSKTWLEISQSALERNLRVFQRHVGQGVKIMAVVKANAYGHGLREVSRVARGAGVDWFGVDHIDEALQLRAEGILQPILVLGYTRRSRLIDCIRNDISFVVYNRETIQELGRLFTTQHKKIGKKKAKIHLKIETGTTRQGIVVRELAAFIRTVRRHPGILIEGVSTHYANIEDTTDHTYAERQLQTFQDALAVFRRSGLDPAWKHSACSAAAILFPETHFNLIRLGVSMYGLWPSKETYATAQARQTEIKLSPVLSWKTLIAQVKTVPKGTSVSYGLTERVTRNSKIAVIPVGYSNGYDRALSSTGTVLVRGKRCKILGRICMNMFMVDVTDVPRVRVEDEVVLIGKQGKEYIPIEDLASHAETIPYEIAARISDSLPRIVCS